MERTPTEKRREPRFAIEAGAVVRLHREGQSVCATTLNMSGCGALLRLAAPVPLAVGDSVVCDFDISSESGETLPCWADGTVVRVDGSNVVAVDFRAGCWKAGTAGTDSSSKAR